MSLGYCSIDCLSKTVLRREAIRTMHDLAWLGDDVMSMLSFIGSTKFITETELYDFLQNGTIPER